MSTNDLYLLQRWSQARDAEAFAEIVSRYSGMVYNTSRRILRNPADAEDVTQECFLELARMGDRVRASLGGWLHRLATSRAVDHIRKDARRRAREAAHAETTQAADRPDWQALQTHIDEAVAALPPELREPVVDHFFMRKTHAEIANEMGLARSSVSHRIEKGIEAVRQYLSKRGVTLGAGALLAAVMELPSEAVSTALATALGRLALLGPAPATSAAGTLLSLPAVKLLVAVVVVAVGIVGAWRLLAPPPPPILTLHDSSAPGPGAAGTPGPASQAARNVVAATFDAALVGSSPRLASATRPYLPAATESVLFGVVWDAERDVPIPGARVRVAQPKTRGASAETTTDAYGAYRLYLPITAPRTARILVAAENHAQYFTDVTLAAGVEQRHDPRLKPGAHLSVKVVDDTGAPVAGASVYFSDGGAGDRALAYSDAAGRVGFTDLDFDRDRTLTAAKEDYTILHAVKVFNLTVADSRREVTLVLRRNVTHVIEGRTTDAEGAPLEGAHIRAGAAFSRVFDTTTDATGAYFLPLRLSPDSPKCVVAAYKPGYTATWKDFIPSSTATAPRQVDFHLEPGHFFAGEVVDASGRPMPGRSVVIDQMDWPTIFFEPGPWRAQRTDENGRFVFRDFPPVPCVIGVNGYPLYKHERQRADPDTVNRYVLTPLGPWIVVKGRVVDANTGAPVREFCVSEEAFFDEGGRFQLRFHPQIFVPTNFTVSAPEYGDYLLKPTYATEDHAEEVVIALSREEPLRCRLIDAASGDPLSNVAVVFGRPYTYDPASRLLVWLNADQNYIFKCQRATTDAAGECVLRDGPAKGFGESARYLYAWPDGHVPVVVCPGDRAALADTDGVLVVPVPRGAEVHGVVTRDGVAVASADVGINVPSAIPAKLTIRPVAANADYRKAETKQIPLRRTTTDADGRFSFTGLPDGNFVLEARMPGDASPLASAEITLAPGEKKTVTLSP